MPRGPGKKGSWREPRPCSIWRQDERGSRETDLSTEQAGAQAPPRFPDPDGHHGRPPGAQCPSGARPEAAQRLKPALAGPLPWNDCGSGRIFSTPRRVPGPPRRPSCCRPARAPTQDRHGSALRCRRRSAMRSSGIAYGGDCAKSCGFRTRLGSERAMTMCWSVGARP